MLRGVTWTDAGSSRRPSASRRISSENVAENSRFWRLRRQEREDLADVADEAHVEHPVGLVEDEDLDPRQVDGPLADVVEQAARRRDDDLGTGAQRADLRIEADAAVDGGRADGVLGAVGPDALLDLERELAGRGQDQRADDARAAGRTRRMEALEHRQHEGGRLAGAGLGAGEDVAAREDERDGLGLDGGGFRVALVGDGTEELGRQPELIEGHGVRLLTRPSRFLRGPVRAQRWIEVETV